MNLMHLSMLIGFIIVQLLPPENYRDKFACSLPFSLLQLFTMICRFTNKAMAGEGNDDGSPFTKRMTTTAEIKAWFGIRFAMACMKISNSTKYWCTMAGWKNNLICATVAQNRFDKIGCLQMADLDDHRRRR